MNITTEQPPTPPDGVLLSHLADQVMGDLTLEPLEEPISLAEASSAYFAGLLAVRTSHLDEFNTVQAVKATDPAAIGNIFLRGVTGLSRQELAKELLAGTDTFIAITE